MKTKRAILRILILVGGITFLTSLSWIHQSFSQTALLVSDLIVSFKGPSSAFQGENISAKIRSPLRIKGM